PSPLARPVLSQADNVGVEQLWRALPHAMRAAADGFNGSWRSPCFSAGSGKAGCPLSRPSDCEAWEAAASAHAPRAASGHLRCLPAALLLGAAGCGSEQLARQLAAHLDVAMVEEPPWWQVELLFHQGWNI
ncbi:MAG: hypothetical protein SGPRY_005363, partial [Prymnesium sp.]